MYTLLHRVLTFCCFLLLLSACHCSVPESLRSCLSNELHSQEPLLSILLEPQNASYESVLESTLNNLRFLNSPKPLAIITAFNYSHVQAAVVCCKQVGLQIRIRSGGHDFEGLSYRSEVPFIILDLQNLRSITVDIDHNSAWVEAGATLGELYYQIAVKSPVHAFPAGICTMVGAGGHFSGGGYGAMLRKHGLAADNILDAYIVDAKGRLLNRESMGADLYWAIRGGGGASFGVIVAWKIKLVHVPPVVTVLDLPKTLEQGVIDLVHQWQTVGHKLNEDLLLYVIMTPSPSGQNVSTLNTSFAGLFLGTADQLLKEMEESFPELGLRKEHCREMRWIDSAMYFSGFPSEETIDALKNRKPPQPKNCIKVKADFAEKPLSLAAVKKLFKFLSEQENAFEMQLLAHGGMMSKISEVETPFPYRKDVIYSFNYLVAWDCQDDHLSEKYISALRRVHDYLTPYVMKHPRGTFFTVRDLDLGKNGDCGTTYSKAKEWGLKYFNNNFKRLAITKGAVDPEDFFYYEQSIPPLAAKDQL